MANKEYNNKDKEKNKKKRTSKDFRELEELKEKEVITNTNKEIQVIKPIEEDNNKWNK